MNNNTDSDSAEGGHLYYKVYLISPSAILIVYILFSKSRHVIGKEPLQQTQAVSKNYVHVAWLRNRASALKK